MPFARRTIASLVLLGALSVGAHSAALAGARNKSEGDKIICKRVDVTGSRLKKPKVCDTKANWDAMSAREQALARRLRDTPSTRQDGVGGARPF